MINKQKIGIMGGSFDPVHNAHIKLALHAYKELQLDKVIFIPAYIQPFKKDKKVTDEVHRMNMLKLGIEEYPYFEVSDIEIQMQGNSYTARTLTVLSDEYSDMVFIMGADSYMSLDRWYHPEIIFEKAEIACAVRDDSDLELLRAKSHEYEEKFKGVTHFLNMPRTDISSTEIREKVAKDEDMGDLLPVKVLDYIKEHKLYG